MALDTREKRMNAARVARPWMRARHSVGATDQQSRIGAGHGYGGNALSAGDPTTLATSLVAFWPLDESSGNALDSHTNSLDLTDVNTVGTNATGSPSGARCRAFTRASAHSFTRADEAKVRLGGQDWSLATWVKCIAVETQTIIAKQDSTSTEELAILVNGATGQWRTYTYDGNTTVANSVENGAGITTAWRSLVITREHSATTLRLYLNGVATGTVDTTESTPAGVGTADFQLGNSFSWAALDGLMSATAFWQGRVLSAADTLTWHNSGSELGYTDIVVAAGTLPPLEDGMLVGGMMALAGGVA